MRVLVFVEEAIGVVHTKVFEVEETVRVILAYQLYESAVLESDRLRLRRPEDCRWHALVHELVIVLPTDAFVGPALPG